MTCTRTPCGITVLRTVGPNKDATKRWTWNPHVRQWSKTSYQAGTWFRAVEHPVGSLAELAKVVDGARRDPRAFVVRGALTADAIEAQAAGKTIRRRKLAKDGTTPSLAEVPRQLFMGDIDGWPLRPSDDLATDPLSAIDHAITELLPPAFHDAECWWQLSSSAGFVPGYLKAHLWFWLSEPATNAHIKAVLAQHAPGLDRAPFSAAQPHYVADPIIEGGYDPLPVRAGWRAGLDEEVVLPALRVEPRKERGEGASTWSPSGNRDPLARLGHGEGGQGFHPPLRSAILAYARRGNRDDDHGAFKDALRRAIRAAPVRPGSASVEDPYCRDYYLDASIAGAFAKLAGDEEVQTMRPHYAAATDTLEAARAALVEHAGGFMGWPSPRRCAGRAWDRCR